MAKVNEIDEIYPEKFFNSPNPNTPWINVQLRNKINGTVTEPDFWTDITADPNNYFNSLTVEDSGGMQKIQLVLFDKEFSEMENKIVNSVFKARMANTLVKQEGTKGNTDDSGLFELKVDQISSLNIRIKFGYSESVDADEDYVGITDADGDEYKKRTDSEKTFLSTPWLYFQILDIKFNLIETGLQITISAVSMVDSFLSKAKMLRKFAVLRGTSTHILEAIKVAVEKTTNNDITIDFEGSPPLPIKNEGPSEEGTFDIVLGSSNDSNSKSWRTLQSIFSELCSKIPQMIFDKANKPVNAEDGGADQSEEMYNSTHYTYMVETKDDKKSIIKFYYPNPSEAQQTKMRTYFWRENGASIVKNLDIESQMDWATMNMQLVTVNTSNEQGPECHLNIARNSNPAKDQTELENLNIDPSNVDISSTHLGSIEEVTKALEDFNVMFVSNYASISGANRTNIGHRIAQQFITNLNQGVFTGTITLPGDPFYLFDNKLRPYEYAIKIVIMRPNYVDKDGEFVIGGSSYLSGYYLVKKITHTINSGGFDTALEIQRWPIKEGA